MDMWPEQGGTGDLYLLNLKYALMLGVIGNGSYIPSNLTRASA